MKEKFNSVKLHEFSLSVAKFLHIQKMAQRILVLFGSTYVCEQTFSVITKKGAHRSQLSDKHLRFVLRTETNTTKLRPDFDALAKTGEHYSH